MEHSRSVGLEYRVCVPPHIPTILRVSKSVEPISKSVEPTFSRVTNLSWFASDFAGFNTESPTIQEIPQAWANQLVTFFILCSFLLARI